MAERIPAAAVDDVVDRRAHLCHAIGIMALSGFLVLDERTYRHADDSRLIAVRERAYALAFRRDRPNARSNVKGAPTDAEFEGLVEMIPVERRENILRSAESLRERGEEFERKYGLGRTR